MFTSKESSDPRKHKKGGLPIWGLTEEKSDTARPLINFCQKMLDHVHSENYKIFFQALLADLTETNFLGEISLQPTPTTHQDSYVIIDENIIPDKAKFVNVISPNGNWINCSLVFKNGLGFLVLDKKPLTYFDLYSELDIKKISVLRVKFLHQPENK